MFVPRNGLFVPPGPAGGGPVWCDSGSDGGDADDADAGGDECFDGGFWLQEGDGSDDGSSSGRSVSSVAFDSAAEMVWVGYNDGRLTSFLREDTDPDADPDAADDDDALPPCDFVRYSAVEAHTGCVLAIDTDDVCSLFLFFFSLVVFLSRR